MSTVLSATRIYSCSQPFSAERIGAAAVYCSDGRYGDHIDEFMHGGLKLPRYDRLAVPGGPACLAGHFAAYREEEGVLRQLEFLIKVHQLTRVALIAHQDCAYYTEWLHVPVFQREARQFEDLQKAADRIARSNRSLHVERYFVRRDGTNVAIEHLG